MASRQETKTYIPPIDPYNTRELGRELSEIHYRLIYFPEVDSTMSTIQRYALGFGPAVIVLTDHQTKGIGREGRVWHDTPGYSIMFSAGFNVKEDAIATYSSLVALKTCLALRKVTGNEKIMIKWPNDIVHEDKKLGGILVSNLYDDQRRHKGTIVGIGINVHYPEEDLASFPTDYGATSLDLVTNSTNKRQEIAKAVLYDIRDLARDAEITHANPAFKGYDKQWKECSSLIGRYVVVTNTTETIQGDVVNVDMRGLFIAGRKDPIRVFDEHMKVRIA